MASNSDGVTIRESDGYAMERRLEERMGWGDEQRAEQERRIAEFKAWQADNAAAPSPYRVKRGPFRELTPDDVRTHLSRQSPPVPESLSEHPDAVEAAVLTADNEFIRGRLVDMSRELGEKEKSLARARNQRRRASLEDDLSTLRRNMETLERELKSNEGKHRALLAGLSAHARDAAKSDAVKSESGKNAGKGDSGGRRFPLVRVAGVCCNTTEDVFRALAEKDGSITIADDGTVSQSDADKLVDLHWAKLDPQVRKLAKQRLNMAWDASGKVPRKGKSPSFGQMVGVEVRASLRKAGIKANNVRASKDGMEIRLTDASPQTISKIEKITAPYQYRFDRSKSGYANKRNDIPQVNSITIKNELSDAARAKLQNKGAGKGRKSVPRGQGGKAQERGGKGRKVNIKMT